MIKNIYLLLVICSLSTTIYAQPTQSVWEGTYSNNFEYFENWQPEGKPGVSDTFYINITDTVFIQYPDNITVTSGYIGQNQSTVNFILNSTVEFSNEFIVGESSTVTTFPYTLGAGNLLNFGTFNISGTTFQANFTNSGLLNIDSIVTFGGNDFSQSGSGQALCGSSQTTFNSEIQMNGQSSIQSNTGSLVFNNDIILDDQSTIQTNASSVSFYNGVVTLGNQTSISFEGKSSTQFATSRLMIIEESSVVVSGSFVDFLSSSNVSLSDNATISFISSSKVGIEEGNWNLYDNASFTISQDTSFNSLIYILNLNDDTTFTIDASSTFTANQSVYITLNQNASLQSDALLFMILNSSSLSLYDNSNANLAVAFFFDSQINLNHSSTFVVTNQFQIGNTPIIAYSNSVFKVNNNVLGFDLDNVNFNDQSSLYVSNSFINSFSNAQFNNESTFTGNNIYMDIVNDTSSLYSVNSTFSINGPSRLTLVNSTVNFGIFNILNSNVNITDSSLMISGKYSFASTNILTQTGADTGSIFTGISMLGNEGYIEIGSSAINFNQTNLSVTNGQIVATIPGLNLDASTLSLGKTSTCSIFSSLTLQGSSSLNNAGYLYLQTSVNNGYTKLQGTITNSRTLNTPNSQQLTFMTHLINSGNATFNKIHISNYTQTNGITVFEGKDSTFTTDNKILINGGQFYGNTTITGDVEVLNGTIGSQTQTNQITINGNFTLSSSASLVLTIASSSESSLFNVEGIANIEGSLTVYVLEPVDKNSNISIINFSSIVGNFSSVNFVLPENDKSDSKCKTVFFTQQGIIVNFGCKAGNKLSGGAIAAIVIGSLVFVGILVFGSYFGYKYYKSKKGGYQPILSN